MRILSDSQRNDNLFVVSLWRHEVFSTIGNQLPRNSDNYWLESTVNDLIKQVKIFLNRKKILFLFFFLEIFFLYKWTAFVR